VKVKNKAARRAKFEDLSSVLLNILEFLDMTPCQIVNSYQFPLFYYKEEATSHICSAGNHFSVDTVRHLQTIDQNFHEVYKCRISKKRLASTALMEAGIYKTNKNVSMISTNVVVWVTSLGTFTKDFQLFMHHFTKRQANVITNGIILYCLTSVRSAHLDY